MRNIAMVGLLLAFVGVAFVPPKPGDYSVSAKTVTIAQKPAKTALHDPTFDVTKQLSAALSGFAVNAMAIVPSIPAHTQNTAQAISATSDTVQVALTQAFDVAKLHNWTDLLSFESNADIRKQIQLIQLAVKKSDIKSCTKLSVLPVEERTIAGVKVKTPSPGDFIAYCLARVTKVKERCDQIADNISLPLRSLCERELGSAQ